MKGGIRVGVGTKFAYDGETLTIIEMFPAGRGNEVLVEDRGGKRRYWLALRELLASGRAILLTDEEGPRSNDPIELAGERREHERVVRVPRPLRSAIDWS
jgi:hypothetical protein